MNYEFRCAVGCSRYTFISCKMSEYDRVKAQQVCCGQQMEPVIYGGQIAFLRDPFPKGYAITEHCCEEPVFCKDKAQLKDLTQENGMISRYLEDDV